MSKIKKLLAELKVGLAEGQYSGFADTQKQARELLKRRPDLKDAIVDILSLAMGEIEDGGSESHEADLASQSLKELETEKPKGTNEAHVPDSSSWMGEFDDSIEIMTTTLAHEILEYVAEHWAESVDMETQPAGSNKSELLAYVLDKIMKKLPDEVSARAGRSHYEAKK
jgi:hypothetical protein